VSSARLKIESRDIMHFLDTEEDYWNRFGQETLEKIQSEGLKFYREEAPRGPTGRLDRALFSEIQGNKVQLGYDLSIAPHAEHIDGHGQTARSEGRYVPAIGRRLKRPSKHSPSIGWHPGSRKTPFTERTMARLESLVTQILTRGVLR
jgi:hypothetical protein